MGVWIPVVSLQVLWPSFSGSTWIKGPTCMIQIHLTAQRRHRHASSGPGISGIRDSDFAQHVVTNGDGVFWLRSHASLAKPVRCMCQTEAAIVSEHKTATRIID